MIGIYSQSVYIYIHIYVWGQYACKFICLLYINIHSISNCLCCVIMKIGFRQNVLVKHVKEYDQHVEGHKIFWYHRPDDTTSERAIFISTSRGLTCIVMELSLVTFISSFPRNDGIPDLGFIDQKLTRIISKSLANPRQELQHKKTHKKSGWWQPEIRRSKPVEVGSWNPIIYRVLAPSNRWLLERSNPDCWLPSTFAKGETAFCRRRPAAPVMSKRTGLQHAPSHSAVAMGVR